MKGKSIENRNLRSITKRVVCGSREIDRDRGGGSRGGDKELKGDRYKITKEIFFQRGPRGRART